MGILIKNENIDDLFVLAIKNDIYAQERLISLYYPDFLRFCTYFCSNTEMGKDLCQESMTRLLVNLSSIRNHKLIKSWLHSTAKNLYLDEVKSSYAKTSQRVDNYDDYFKDNLSSSLSLLHDLNRVLSLLTPKDRLILLLVDLEHYSYKEASIFLCVTEETVRSRLHKARKKFILLFEETNPLSQSS